MDAALRKTVALLGKDARDMVRNPTMLVCCLLPLAFIVLFDKTMGANVDANGEAAQSAFDAMMLSYALLFTSTMVSSMATTTAIAEEREKSTLRTLMLANVGAGQILLSRGMVALAVIAVVDAACYLALGQPAEGLAAFLAIGMAGSVPIVLVSLLMGLAARDQMSAGLLSMPILLVGIAPMLSPYLDRFSEIAVYLPTGGMNELGALLAKGALLTPDALPPVLGMLAWIVAAGAAFALVYRRLSRDN